MSLEIPVHADIIRECQKIEFVKYSRYNLAKGHIVLTSKYRNIWTLYFTYKTIVVDFCNPVEDKIKHRVWSAADGIFKDAYTNVYGVNKEFYEMYKEMLRIMNS